MTCEEQLLVKELRSGTCRCGEPKMQGRTFCKRCYYRLPAAFRQQLYQRIGDGYARAYETARQTLFGNLDEQDPLAQARESDATWPQSSRSWPITDPLAQTREADSAVAVGEVA